MFQQSANKGYKYRLSIVPTVGLHGLQLSANKDCNCRLTVHGYNRRITMVASVGLQR